MLPPPFLTNILVACRSELSLWNWLKKRMEAVLAYNWGKLWKLATVSVNTGHYRLERDINITVAVVQQVPTASTNQTIEFCSQSLHTVDAQLQLDFSRMPLKLYTYLVLDYWNWVHLELKAGKAKHLTSIIQSCRFQIFHWYCCEVIL